MTNKPAFQTLEDIQLHMNNLNAEITKQNETISTLWTGLFEAKKSNTKGEMVASIVANSITAIDAFLLVRKLMTRYGAVFRRKKKGK